MPKFEDAVIGADPGGTGCVVTITKSRTIRFVRLGQYERRLWLPALSPLFREINLLLVLNERTHGRRGDKSNTAETFGRNTGSLEVAMWYHMDRVAPKLEIEYIQDQLWQRKQSVAGIKDRDDRIRAYQMRAQKKFPDLKVTQDMGAGILIAEVAWERLWGF